MPTATTIDIPDFEGEPVAAVGLSIRNTGHGFEKIMEVAPRVFSHGEEFFVVLKCEVEKIRHDLVAKGDLEGDLMRVHMAAAGSVTFIDADLVAEQIRAMDARIEEHEAAKKAAKDKAKTGDDTGIVDLDAQQHMLDHEDGKHADGLVDGCPRCQDEQAAVDAETAEQEANRTREDEG